VAGIQEAAVAAAGVAGIQEAAVAAAGVAGIQEVAVVAAGATTRVVNDQTGKKGGLARFGLTTGRETNDLTPP
jgi:hypothetical protein